MADGLYTSLIEAHVGYVEAPAGCGKTEAIVKAVQNVNGKQLILTHTNAGVSALKKRFKNYQIPPQLYHIETISSWAWKWVRKYPDNAEYDHDTSSNPTDWVKVYHSAVELLKKDFVQFVVDISYSGVIVDEYQDCTVSMHNLIWELKHILPCRVLGDPLQGIFDLNRYDPIISWESVTSDFEFKLDNLNEPYRWKNRGNQKLGEWVIGNRDLFKCGNIQEVHKKIRQDSPIHYETVQYKWLISKLNEIITNCGQGSICIIGPKHGNIKKI